MADGEHAKPSVPNLGHRFKFRRNFRPTHTGGAIQSRSLVAKLLFFETNVGARDNKAEARSSGIVV